MKKFVTKSEKETIDLAKRLAKDFTNGGVVGLIGDLGFGKTQFVKGLAEAFQIKKAITSPTFVILKKYPVKIGNIKNLIHIDCYRFFGSDDLSDLGFEEFVQDGNNLIVVEWADRVRDIMPADTQWIQFKRGKEDNERIITIR